MSISYQSLGPHSSDSVHISFYATTFLNILCAWSESLLLNNIPFKQKAQGHLECI